MTRRSIHSADAVSEPLNPCERAQESRQVMLPLLSLMLLKALIINEGSHHDLLLTRHMLFPLQTLMLLLELGSQRQRPQSLRHEQCLHRRAGEDTSMRHRLSSAFHCTFLQRNARHHMMQLTRTRLMSHCDVTIMLRLPARMSHNSYEEVSKASG
jgi:hypothetical protein